MCDRTSRPSDPPDRQRVDFALAPWAAELVVERRPFECMVSGRGNGRVALRLTHRWDPTVAPVLIDPVLLSSLIELGLRRLESLLDSVA